MSNIISIVLLCFQFNTILLENREKKDEKTLYPDDTEPELVIANNATDDIATARPTYLNIVTMVNPGFSHEDVQKAELT